MSFRQLTRHQPIMATAAAAIAVIIAGGVLAATGVGSHQAASAAQPSAASQPGPAGQPAAKAKPSGPAAPLQIESVTPADGTSDANGASPVTITFNEPLAATTPRPSLSPEISGTWTVAGSVMTFRPDLGYQQHSHVTLTIPGGASGVRAAGLDPASGPATTAQTDLGLLAKSATVSFATSSYSTLRLQQLLAQLGYLPLTFSPSDAAAPAIPVGSTNAQLSAAYNPPAGSFTFQGGYPSQLTSQWATGKSNVLDTGAVMAFEYDNGLTMDGVAGPAVWKALFSAVAKGKTNPNGYTYSLADQHSPETLRVWHDGKLIEDTPANTGVAGAGTADGTYPVFSRFQVTQMKGTNVDGTKYDDTVRWVSYFNGGDALHYFPRPGYGYYQSNGCVEIQLAPAKYIWNYTTYGSLVTVIGPEA